MSRNQILREHVLELLRGGGAHTGPDEVIRTLPAHLRGRSAPGSPHTPWRLLEHMRIAQWDILEFSRNPAHVSPAFPGGYWPAGDAPPDEAAWEASALAFRSDRMAMEELVSKAEDLLAPLPHGTGQSLLREALLVADHNAYHLGQFVLIRRILGD